MFYFGLEWIISTHLRWTSWDGFLVWQITTTDYHGWLRELIRTCPPSCGKACTTYGSAKSGSHTYGFHWCDLPNHVVRLKIAHDRIKGNWFHLFVKSKANCFILHYWHRDLHSRPLLLWKSYREGWFYEQLPSLIIFCFYVCLIAELSVVVWSLSWVEIYYVLVSKRKVLTENK